MVWPNFRSCFTLHCCAGQISMSISCLADWHYSVYATIELKSCSAIHLHLFLLFQRPLTEFHSVFKVISIQCKQELWVVCFERYFLLDMMCSCVTYPCFTGTSVCWFPWQTFELGWYICSISFQSISMFPFLAVCVLWMCYLRHTIVSEDGGFVPNSLCHVCCSEGRLCSSILLTFKSAQGLYEVLTIQDYISLHFPLLFPLCQNSVSHHSNTNSNVNVPSSVLLCFGIVQNFKNVVTLFWYTQCPFLSALFARL